MATEKQMLQDFLDAFILAATAAGVSVADANSYWTGTNIEAVLNEILTQIGGATSTTYNFTEANVVADNDAVYAALQKLDLKWGDLASTSNGEGASLVGIEDTGAHFAAAEANVEAALAKLAKTIIITVPRFTGWTKDDTDQTPAIPLLESPVPIVIKRAYANLGTASGSGGTIVIKVNTSTAITMTDTATQGEAEALAIAIAKDTDIVVTIAETTSKAGANCDLILVAQVDDGE